MVGFVDHFGIGERAVKEDVGEEGRCLLFVQLFEVRYPMLFVHLVAPFLWPTSPIIGYSPNSYSDTRRGSRSSRPRSINQRYACRPRCLYKAVQNAAPFDRSS